MNSIEECHVCGGDAQLVREPTEITIGHRSAMVPAERMRCGSCGSEFYLPGQMDGAQKLAAAQMRAAEGLLEPEEIKAIRHSVGLTQPELEKLLGIGSKTVVRWERGTVFQNSATDALLRLVRDVPEAAAYLATSSGVRLRRPAMGNDSPSAAAEPSWRAAFNAALRI